MTTRLKTDKNSMCVCSSQGHMYRVIKSQLSDLKKKQKLKNEISRLGLGFILSNLSETEGEVLKTCSGGISNLLRKEGSSKKENAC